MKTLDEILAEANKEESKFDDIELDEEDEEMCDVYPLPERLKGLWDDDDGDDFGNREWYNGEIDDNNQ